VLLFIFDLRSGFTLNSRHSYIRLELEGGQVYAVREGPLDAAPAAEEAGDR